MPQSVAISGASGFVGSALQAALAERGARVVRLVRHRAEHERAPGDTLLWDPLGSGLEYPERLSGFDAVFHLAGRSIASRRWNPAEKERIRASRVDATRILARQLADLETPPAVVLSASAIGIYGDRGDDEIVESDPPADDFLAKVALGWEQACQPLLGVATRVVHPRLGVVLGRGGGALRAMLPVFRFGLGGKLGSGRQFFSWVSLSDCVRSLLWMLDNAQAHGAYNIVSPQPVRNAVFAKTLGKALKRPAFLPAPALAIRCALGTEMANALLLNSQRVLPQRLLEGGFSFQDPELSPFLNRLCNQG